MICLLLKKIKILILNVILRVIIEIMKKIKIKILIFIILRLYRKNEKKNSGRYYFQPNLPNFKWNILKRERINFQAFLSLSPYKQEKERKKKPCKHEFLIENN